MRQYPQTRGPWRRSALAHPRPVSGVQACCDRSGQSLTEGMFTCAIHQDHSPHTRYVHDPLASLKRLEGPVEVLLLWSKLIDIYCNRSENEGKF